MRVIDPKCPECGGAMRDGLLLDQAPGAYARPQWVEGPPEKSIWTGLKIKGRERWYVATYRCVECGFLKSYAREAAG